MNTLHISWRQGVEGNVDPRFEGGLPFPVPEILGSLKHFAIRVFVPDFPAIFPGILLGDPRKHSTNSHRLFKFSDGSRLVTDVGCPKLGKYTR